MSVLLFVVIQAMSLIVFLVVLLEYRRVLRNRALLFARLSAPTPSRVLPLALAGLYTLSYLLILLFSCSILLLPFP